MTRYTQANGFVSNSKTDDAKFGPYIRGGALPANSFNDLSAVLCDTAQADITIRASAMVIPNSNSGV